MLVLIDIGDDRAGVAEGATNAALARPLLLLLPAIERTVARTTTDDEEEVIIDLDRFPARMLLLLFDEGAMILFIFFVVINLSTTCESFLLKTLLLQRQPLHQ
jgi:hypothetical protein